MKAPTASSRFRLSVVMPLICGFFCLFLATGVLAGDPDDDWGLPTAPSDEDDSTSSSTDDPSDIQIGSEVIESEPDDALGLLLVDTAGDDGTSFVEGVDPAEADVAPVQTGKPVLVDSLSDGLAMQGRLLLSLPFNGDGPLQATIRSPVDAVEVRALLTIDDLDSIDELLADPSGVPAGVSTVLSVGDVAVVNLNAFQSLVDTNGHLLGVGHVSVVVLSTDSSGSLHVAAARIATTGGPMEVLIR